MRQTVATLLLVCAWSSMTFGMSFLRRSVTSTWDPYTMLLLHFDGVDAATTTVDSARAGTAPHTVTFFNDAQLDTAEKQYGTASFYPPQTGTDYLTVSESALFDPGTKAFTIECWAYRTSNDNVGFLWDHATDNDNRWAWYVLHTGGGLPGKMSLLVQVAGVAEISLTANTAMTLNTWQHLAVVRSGNDWTLYLDGAAVGTLNDAQTIPDHDGPLYIGRTWDAAGPWDGWLDEYRYSYGIARYTGAFVPAGPFNP